MRRTGNQPGHVTTVRRHHRQTWVTYLGTQTCCCRRDEPVLTTYRRLLTYLLSVCHDQISCILNSISNIGGFRLGPGGIAPKYCPAPPPQFLVGSIVISLRRCCLPNDEGPILPPKIFFPKTALISKCVHLQRINSGVSTYRWRKPKTGGVWTPWTPMDWRPCYDFRFRVFVQSWCAGPLAWNSLPPEIKTTVSSLAIGWKLKC